MMKKNSNIFYFAIGICWGISVAPSLYHFHFIDFLKSGHLASYSIMTDNTRIISSVDNFLGRSCIVFYIIIFLLLTILYLLDNGKQSS